MTKFLINCLVIGLLVKSVNNLEVRTFSSDEILFEYQGMTIIEREFEGIKLFKMLAGNETIYYIQTNETDMTFHLHYNQFNFYLKKLGDAILLRDDNNPKKSHYVEALIVEATSSETGEVQYTIQYGDVTKEVQVIEYNYETKNKGFWIMKDCKLLFVSEFSSDGYYLANAAFCKCKAYETKFSDKSGYFLKCCTCPHKIVALREDYGAEQPTDFFIVISGQKLKAQDITKLHAGLLLNLHQTAMIIEIIPGIYFQKIGYWLLLDEIYVFASTCEVEGSHAIMFHGAIILVEVHYSITSKKVPMSYETITISDFSNYLITFFAKDDFDVKKHERYFIHEGNPLVQLIPIKLMKGAQRIDAQVCLVELAVKVYGLLVFVEDKQYVIVKASDCDADVITIFVDDKPIRFVHSIKYSGIDGLTLINGDKSYFNKMIVISQTSNGIDGYWIDNHEGLSKFVSEVPTIVSGFWIYSNGRKLYVNDYELSNGLYVKKKLITTVQLIPIRNDDNQYNLNPITDFGVLDNGRLSTVEIVPRDRKEMEIVYDGIKYYVAHREPISGITSICLGEQYTSGTYHEAVIGNATGYWFQNSDGPLFLLLTNEYDNNAITAYINGKRTLLKTYNSHTMGTWKLIDNKYVFVAIEINMSQKYGVDGYLMKLDDGKEKFYFETDSSSTTGIWIEFDGQKKYVVEDLYFLSDSVYIIFYITHNGHRYPVYTNRKTKEFWIYMNGVKYILQLTNNNFSEDIYINKSGGKYLLLKRSKICPCN